MPCMNSQNSLHDALSFRLTKSKRRNPLRYRISANFDMTSTLNNITNSNLISLFEYLIFETMTTIATITVTVTAPLMSVSMQLGRMRQEKLRVEALK